jgi:hypothetical protein
VADRFSGPDCVAALLVSADDGAEYRIGPPGQPATVAVTGQTRELLAWLIGRAAGNRLITEPADPLPTYRCPSPKWPSDTAKNQINAFWRSGQCSVSLSCPPRLKKVS